jgi:hypothetical protein
LSSSTVLSSSFSYSIFSSFISFSPSVSSFSSSVFSSFPSS